jgi:fatty acid desaturase
MPGTLAPPISARPQVLPTGRLFASGKMRPAAADDLRAIPTARNIYSVLTLWCSIIGSWWLVGWLAHPLAWIAGVFWVGRCFSLLFLLHHEAAHALLFPARQVNDFVGRYLLGAAAIVDFDLYRMVHITHHRDELGPEEPDLGLYVGYPSGWAKFFRRLSRDAFGRSAYKQLRALARRPAATLVRLASAQLVVGFLIALVTGHWWAWPVLWLLPWATVWQVTNRLRSIAEHAGMEQSDDRRANSHVVNQSWLPQQWLAPYKAGFHLAHHVDTSVPWVNLPRFHSELESAGFVTPDITHDSYRALWRYLLRGHG